MSRLDELIAELCPDGVEYKKLGDVATISRGGNFQKKDYVESGVPCIHYGQIYVHYGLFVEKTISFISKEKAEKQKFAEPNDVIMAVTSENIDDVCKCIAWLGTEKVAVSGHAAIIHHSLNPKYLVYYLHSAMFYQQKTKLAHGTKVIEVTPNKLNDIILPVPPLEVQREIVRILDNFTELTAELTAELAARKQQYKVYCRKLIEELSDAKDTCIGDLGSWSGGSTPSMSNKEFWEDGTFPWVSSKDMKVSVLTDTEDHVTQKALDNTSIKLLPTDVVAIVARSGILKHTLPIVYIPVQVTVNQDIKALVCKEGILPKYVFFALQGYHDELLAKTKKQGGTVDSLEIKKFMDFKIPVPSYKEQQRIVDILTRFDTLCNDISSGLPAEIVARQKQYEYYRDKLLTFKQLA